MTKKRDKSTPKYVQDPLTPEEQGVLNHLNYRTGRRYRMPNGITFCLQRGVTVEELCLVIDWWADSKVIHDPDQDRYFDNETPFRQKHFDKYRAAAEAWDRQGRPHPQSKYVTRSPSYVDQKQAFVANEMDKFIKGGPDAGPTGPRALHPRDEAVIDITEYHTHG